MPLFCSARYALPVSLILLSGSPGMATPPDYAVEVSATVQESPPQIEFSWPADLTADQYYIYRKAQTDTLWGEPLAVLDGSATSYTDMGAVVGEAYEYAFRKTLGFSADTVQVAAGHPLTFTVFDSWGDGMCCQRGIGGYEVSGGGEIYASGGEFGNSESTSFMVACDELIVAVTPDAFPPETTWLLIDDSTGDTLAEGGPYQSPRFGHIFAGIRYPAIEDRGAVLLLVFHEIAAQLDAEIDRFELDLIRDGYRAHRHSVEVDDEVSDVKDLIIGERALDPTIGTVVLIGHVPVPYSGDLLGVHTDHQGAWPADLYYGELDGEWTDYLVNNTAASRPENDNIPGDGKFDQTFLPSNVDLKVGRVDLSRMPGFPLDEIGLTGRYFDKNHAYRSGAITPERRGLIDDNVGDSYGLAFAANGWRNFAPMFGAGNSFELDYFNTLEQESYLWSYGCGGGTYQSCFGVGTTYRFTASNLQTVFTMLYGSYFGDWDNTDNFLRAPLAADGQTLACFWAGRPAWHLHHMALGHTLGYSTRLTQNNNALYTISDGTRQVHIALMGDPTLKMHIVKPAGTLSVERTTPGKTRLSWYRSADLVEGYHIFRASHLHGTFARINTEAVVDTVYVDTEAPPETCVYMVRAVKLESSGSGTYCNLSAGVVDSITAATDVPEETLPLRVRLAPSRPNPFNPETLLRFELPQELDIRLAVYDIRGRTVRLIHAGALPAGSHSYHWDGKNNRGQNVPSGVYYARLEVGGEKRTCKMLLLR